MLAFSLLRDSMKLSVFWQGGVDGQHPCAAGSIYCSGVLSRRACFDWSTSGRLDIVRALCRRPP